MTKGNALVMPLGNYDQIVIVWTIPAWPTPLTGMIAEHVVGRIMYLWWDGNGSKLQFQKKQQNKSYSAFQPSILGSITLSCISPFPSMYTCCWRTMAFISWKTYLTRPMTPLQVGLRRSITAPGRKGPRRCGLWETGQKIMIMQGTSAYVWAVKGLGGR